MMQLKFTKDALKFVQSLDAKQYKQVVATVLGLVTNQNPHDSSGLSGAKNGEKRVDIGEYRIIYAVDPDAEIVEVLVIGKRNGDEVYKKWERMK
jgi:mRNA interferase RelE/StbE